MFIDALGAGAILEHHSGDTDSTDDEDAYESPHKRRATENWEAPIIVTTPVGFFESLFSHRPADLRRVHNIALRDIPLYGALDPSIPFGWQYELKNTPMSVHVTGLKYSDTVTVQGGQPKGCTVTAVDQASTAWEAYADFSTIVP